MQRFTFRYETESGEGVITTLPIDLVLAEGATGRSVIQDGISFTLVTRMVHTALTRAAKAGRVDPVPPYEAWMLTVLDITEVEAATGDDAPMVPPVAAASNGLSPAESAASLLG